MIKVLIDARMLNDSGIGVYIRNLTTQLQNSPEISFSYILKKESAEEFVSEEYSVFNSAIYSISEQIEFFKKRRQCDVFWSPHFNIPLVYLKSKKRLVTIHDVYHLAFFNTLSLKQKVYAKLMISASLFYSDKIVTVSDFSKREIIKYTGCDAGKITVIHNGTKQKCTVKDEFFIREKYSLPENYILFVGNVKPHKNLKVLVSAFSKLQKERFEGIQNLVIVGKKSGFLTGDNEIADVVNSDLAIRDKVYFTGFVDDEDLDSVYAYASLFVFPSLYEGFGLPPLEAMICGCPVICSDRASMPEICGDAVEYFNPEDSEELADKIKSLSFDTEKRTSLIEKGYERVRKFTWTNSAEKHLEILKSFA